MIPLILSFAFLSAIAYSISSIAIKALLHYIKNPVHLLLYNFTLKFFLILGIAVILILVNSYPTENLPIENVILIILSTVFIFFGIISLYHGFNVGNVSVGGLVLSSRVIVSVFFAIIILNELFSYTVYLLILIIFFGISLTSWQEELTFRLAMKDSGTIFFLITIFLWGIANTIIGAMNNEVFIITFLLIRFFVLSVLLLLLYPKLNNVIADGTKIEISWKTAFYVLLLVIIATIADASSIIALGYSVTITEAIAVFQGVLVFIIVMLLSQNNKIKEIFKEPLKKKTIMVRSIGIIIATIAIMILTIELSSLNI